MSYLVDTNVLSESVKKNPDPKVIEWLRIHESKLYVSVISLGEICRGIERLAESKKKEMLRFWLESISDSMKGRILSFDLETAHIWGILKARLEQEGLVIPSLDSQIAATAEQYQLTIVTRNVKDFLKTGKIG